MLAVGGCADPTEAASTDTAMADDGHDDGVGDEDTTGDGEAACTVEFEAAAPGTFTTWTVRNGRDVPLYLPGILSICTHQPFSVFDGETDVVWHEGSWTPTCEMLTAGDCGWGSSDGPSTVIKLMPGASWDFTFGLYGYGEVALPAAFVEGTECAPGTTCRVGRPFVEQPLTLSIPVTETCVADGCACEGDACSFVIGNGTLPWPDTETVDFAYDGGLEGSLFEVL